MDTVWEERIRPLASWAYTLKPEFDDMLGIGLEPVDFAESNMELDAPQEPKRERIAYVQVRSSLVKEIEPRLRELQSEFIDDYGRQISSKSLFALKALLQFAIGIRRPLLSVEPSGNLIATWRKSGASISLRFINGGEIHFAYGGSAAHEKARGPRYGQTSPTTFFAESGEAKEIAS